MSKQEILLSGEKKGSNSFSIINACRIDMKKEERNYGVKDESNGYGFYSDDKLEINIGKIAEKLIQDPDFMIGKN